MQMRDAHMAHDFFHCMLGLHWSDDFRGVLYVPDEYMGTIAKPEHVAIAVGYNAFIGRTCCMHSIIQRPELVTRKIVRETFEYPFEVCHCEAVLALVDSTNIAAINFDTKLGFREVHRIPWGGTDGDLVVLQMLKSECRWLKRNLH